ncbi:MAG TPA: hypothetical protein VI873_00800, partial [Candidatus Peribacteraceae bacterium]|nr:hypothetical protein [Candidatus Peribacteraceae bacterium]
LKQPIIIRVRPHLEGQCGAAALARKLRGEKDMSAKAVDDEAMAGAERTAKRIRELAGGAVPVKVIVEPFDRRNFYDDPNHPELGMLVNGTDMVINGDRKKGPMLFNVSTKLAGEQVATDDAVLSGVIALVLHHGMHESIQGLPKGTPYRIIFAGTKEDTDRLKRKTEATLRAHKDLGQFYMKKEIIVETWVQGKKSKQSMRQSLKDRKELTQSWLDPVNTHIEQTRKVIAQQQGFSGKKPWTRGQRNAA